MRCLAGIVGQPLRIVRELGETSFEPVIFAHLVSAVRYPQQIGVLDRFGAILFRGEHIFSLSEKMIPTVNVGEIA